MFSKDCIYLAFSDNPLKSQKSICLGWKDAAPESRRRVSGVEQKGAEMDQETKRIKFETVKQKEELSIRRSDSERRDGREIKEGGWGCAFFFWSGWERLEIYNGVEKEKKDSEARRLTWSFHRYQFFLNWIVVRKKKKILSQKPHKNPGSSALHPSVRLSTIHPLLDSLVSLKVNWPFLSKMDLFGRPK